MTSKVQGGVRDEAVELRDYAPSGSADGGVSSSGLDSPPTFSAPPLPIYVTIIVPYAGKSVTIPVPFGETLTIAHDPGISITSGFAFPVAQRESDTIPIDESDPLASDAYPPAGSISFGPTTD